HRLQGIGLRGWALARTRSDPFHSAPDALDGIKARTSLPTYSWADCVAFVIGCTDGPGDCIERQHAVEIPEYGALIHAGELVIRRLSVALACGLRPDKPFSRMVKSGTSSPRDRDVIWARRCFFLHCGAEISAA